MSDRDRRPPAPRYSNEARPGPPADDDRDPVDPHRPARTSTSGSKGGGTSMLNARISAQHRSMIDEVLAARENGGDARLAKVRFVVEDLIQAGYDQWKQQH